MESSEAVVRSLAQPASVFADILGRDNSARLFVLGPSPRPYGDLLAAANSIAKQLQSRGCGGGSRVGICLDQGIEYAACLLAVWQVGGISVLMAPAWTIYERERVLRHSGMRFILADATQLTQTTPLRSAPVDDPSCILFEYAEPGDSEEPETGDAVIIYTSGTTGDPKGVVLTDASIAANVAAVAAYLGLGGEDSAPIFTPSCYAYSLSQNLAQAWVGGATVPVPSGLRFPLDVLRAVSECRLTGISATPTAVRMLCDVGIGTDLDLTSVRFVMCGGQGLDQPLVQRINSVFRHAEVVNMYGCTENSPRISYLYIHGTDGMDKQGYYSVGRPVLGTRIRIENEEGGPAGPREIGEVLITGTSLMRGYWKDRAETEARVRDGWFHTRDIGYLDDNGMLHLTGRQSNIINIGNEKVSPEEVERVLLEVPGVHDAVVYGAPDPLLGETVEAQLVFVADSALTVEVIQRHCRKQLSSYKVPRRIRIVDGVPRTLYGKIDRRRLREIGSGNESSVG
jgi:acyl-CoA synthetase (AMP-forming)/AMP-acid ligase II